MPDFVYSLNNQQRRRFTTKPTATIDTRKKKLTLFNKSNHRKRFTLLSNKMLKLLQNRFSDLTKINISVWFTF